MIRMPAVAGQFYPADPEKLNKEIESYMLKTTKTKRAIGLIVPHAGYMYSGRVAGQVYSLINVPDRVLILGPNHTGVGADAAVFAEGIWKIPGAEIEIDRELANTLLEHSSIFTADTDAHRREHSLEVQVPFLYNRNRNFKMVPLCLANRNYRFCKEAGNAIAGAIQKIKEDVLLVASTDMTHYEPHEIAKSKDRFAIQQIEKLSPRGLFDTVIEKDISMCGVIPATTMLIAAKELGASSAELIIYETSGDTSGDYTQVVGYAGMVVY